MLPSLEVLCASCTPFSDFRHSAHAGSWGLALHARLVALLAHYIWGRAGGNLPALQQRRRRKYVRTYLLCAAFFSAELRMSHFTVFTRRVSRVSLAKHTTKLDQHCVVCSAFVCQVTSGPEPLWATWRVLNTELVGFQFAPKEKNLCVTAFAMMCVPVSSQLYLHVFRLRAH